MKSFDFFFLSIVLGLIIIVSGCNKKPETVVIQNKMEFSWNQHLTMQEVPDFPVKGFLRGKEITFSYINCEKWRGPDDNVLTFSLVSPKQNCGFIEDFQGVKVTRKGRTFEIGKYEKNDFDDNFPDFQVSFIMKSGDGSPVEYSNNWNLALSIDSISEKNVSGKLALCFNDDSKSWIAGKFEMPVCNN